MAIFPSQPPNWMRVEPFDSISGVFALSEWAFCASGDKKSCSL